MRVNPLYVSNLVEALGQTVATQQQLTQQLASGKRVNSPSDDPVASGQNVLLSNQISRDDFYPVLDFDPGHVAGDRYSAGLGGLSHDGGDRARDRCEQWHYECR